MKHLLTNLIICCGALLLLCPTYSKAESYTLLCSLVVPSHGTPSGSKVPRKHMVIDITNNTITFPNQVIGNTLILESEEGEIYTYNIIDAVFILPQELSGEYSLNISDGNSMYHGVINIK